MDSYADDKFSTALPSELLISYPQIDWRAQLPEYFFYVFYHRAVNVQNVSYYYYLYYSVLIYARGSIPILVPLLYYGNFLWGWSVSETILINLYNQFLPSANVKCQGVRWVSLSTNDSAGWTTALSLLPEHQYQFYNPANLTHKADIEDLMNSAGSHLSFTGPPELLMRFISSILRRNANITSAARVDVIKADLTLDEQSEQSKAEQDLVDETNRNTEGKWGMTQFPLTPGNHMVFWDGHSVYIPNGTMINATLTRRYNKSVGETRAWVIVTSVLDPLGFWWRAAVLMAQFVAYGKGEMPAYPKNPPKFPKFQSLTTAITDVEISELNQQYLHGVAGSLLAMKPYLTTALIVDENITDNATAIRVGRDMEKLGDFNVLKSMFGGVIS